MTRPTPRASLLCSAALLAASVLSSCVAKAKYDEATQQVQLYQREFQRAKATQDELQAENTRLKGELGAYESAGPAEASVTRGIDERMAELQKMAGSLGAPGDVTVLSVEGGYGLRLSDAILFQSGSAEVRPEGQDVLARMAKEISSRPFQRVWVRGHTDSDPVKKPETLQRFPHGNLQLSAARAIEVAVALGKAGVDPSRIVVAGFGASDPVVPNVSATNKQKNRRVEIFVIDDESKDEAKAAEASATPETSTAPAAKTAEPGGDSPR